MPVLAGLGVNGEHRCLHHVPWSVALGGTGPGGYIGEHFRGVSRS